MVQMIITSVHSSNFVCSTLDVKPYVRKHFSVGNEFIDVDGIKQLNPHRESTALKGYSYASPKMIFHQDMVEFTRLLEYFATDQKYTPIAVRLPLAWVSSGPLPSTSGLLSTWITAVSQIESDFKLAYQIQHWYNMESFSAYKQVIRRSMLGVRKYWKTQRMMTAADIGSVCCRPTIEAVWRINTFPL